MIKNLTTDTGRRPTLLRVKESALTAPTWGTKNRKFVERHGYLYVPIERADITDPVEYAWDCKSLATGATHWDDDETLTWFDSEVEASYD